MDKKKFEQAIEVQKEISRLAGMKLDSQTMVENVNEYKFEPLTEIRRYTERPGSCLDKDTIVEIYDRIAEVTIEVVNNYIERLQAQIDAKKKEFDAI